LNYTFEWLYNKSQARRIIMSLWKQPATVAALNQRSQNTLATHLNITFTQITDNTIIAIMPVTQEIMQPRGIMHGGASCVLAETVGSTAANVAVDPKQYYCVGQSIYTNHISTAKQGILTATATAIHLGKSTHVWHISITDSTQKLVSNTQLTMAVLRKKQSA
jgi:1,4-dihydroxy-2-naphthoyl-CoA hydrolase